MCNTHGLIPLPLTIDNESFARVGNYLRAGNYLPRNQYRDRFFDENGTQITVPGAIPKSQRSYTTAPLTTTSSTNQRDYDPYYPRAEDIDPQEEERPLDSEDGLGGSGGNDGFNFYGRSPWGHANWLVEDLEGGEDTTKKKITGGESRRGSRRRSLQASDAEPAVESPLSCISQGDSVLFDISSGCYPVYEKDSLLNSNLE